MSIKAKRQQELDSLKEKRMEEVVAAAIMEMQEKGIDNAKISDIALRAEVGVASVYRYFKTKQELVIAAATQLWSDEIHEVYSSCEKQASKASDCIEKISTLLEAFVELYNNHKGFLRFIEEFDNYIIKEKIESSKLTDYETKIDQLKEQAFQALEQGQAQGILRKDIDMDLYYTATTHSLMSLTQKLVLRGAIIESDKTVDGEAQIRLLIHMSVSYLINRR